MRRFPEKILAIFLAILLGMAPLHNTMAGFADLSPHKPVANQSIDLHHDMVMSTVGHPDKACDQCGDEDTCPDHACSSNLCTSFPVALLSTLSLPANSVVSSALLPADDGLVKRHSSPLFRPPRA